MSARPRSSRPASKFRCGHSRGRLGSRAGSRAATNAVPPGPFAGNLDNRDLVEGTTLHVPVFVRGALVWQGDSHAAQGNGEVNLTGLETAFQEITLTITVDKTTKLEWPRIEAPTEWITMRFDEDLTKALANAKAETAKFLVEQRKTSPDQAMALVSKTSDCRVTQVVDIAAYKEFNITVEVVKGKPLDFPRRNRGSRWASIRT
jgi:acetamidase/formamidase